MKAKKAKDHFVISEEVLRNFSIEEVAITKTKEWKNMYSSGKRLHESCLNHSIPFDPRFNAVHWALDAYVLCQQIAYSYCWMNAYAKAYMNNVPEGSALSHTDFFVNYFADNCITRIDSLRDKIALMVWAYYCPFNPEKQKEVLVYEEIIEKLKTPIKFGLRLPISNPFLRFLLFLQNSDFKALEKYRHFKIHRLEPQIVIYGVKEHTGWSYLLPLTEEKEIKQFRKEIEKQNPTPQDISETIPGFSVAQDIENRCKLHGVLFDQRRIKNQYWSYSSIEKNINRCLYRLFEATDGCIRILLRRKPIRRK